MTTQERSAAWAGGHGTRLLDLVLDLAARGLTLKDVTEDLEAAPVRIPAVRKLNPQKKSPPARRTVTGRDGENWQGQKVGALPGAHKQI